MTASFDRTAKVWDANTGQELTTLKGHEDRVMSAVYSPDGKRIATAGMDGIVQIYTTDINELLQIAESRVIRPLTAEEKERYGGLGLVKMSDKSIYRRFYYQTKVSKGALIRFHLHVCHIISLILNCIRDTVDCGSQ